MMEISPPGVGVISSGKHGRAPGGKTPPSGRGDTSRQKTEGDGPDDVRYAFASTCTISPDVRRSLLQAKSNQWFRHVEVRPGKVVTYFAVPSESRIDDLSRLQLKEVWSARSAEYIVREHIAHEKVVKALRKIAETTVTADELLDVGHVEGQGSEGL